MPERPLSTAPETVSADQALGRRLIQAPAYPLRGAALVAVVTLALLHALVGLLPSVIAEAAQLIVWASTILYAMQCLRHTADGYAQPPEITHYDHYGPALSLLLLKFFGLIALIGAGHGIPLLWLLILALIILFPVIAMALAFEDNMLAALHPGRWGRVMSILGSTYLIPIAMGVLENLFYVAYLKHAGGLSGMLWFVPVVYLNLLQFHVMGILIHRHHEPLGHVPAADTLARATGRDADDALLADVQALQADGDPESAEALLRDRLNSRSAPQRVHAAYRQLLHGRGDHETLLEHAHVNLATLLLEDQTRRALALSQECLELDPHFMPTDPEIAAELADAAAAQGMTQLALKLARGYPNTWPRDPHAAKYGLLAARLLADRLGRDAEAGVLAEKLRQAFPHDPLRDEIDRFIAHLNPSVEPSSKTP